MSPRKKNSKKSRKYRLKTHKATAKRFRTTGSGKVMRMKSARSHLRRRKSKRSKRLFKRMLPVEAKGNQRSIKRLAPNLKKLS